jgi:hypothetical protein
MTSMSDARPASAAGRSRLWELLTLEQLMTGSLIHLVYWCGLGVIALAGFGVVGAAIGVALREGILMGWLLAIPTIVAGLLVVAIAGVLWRSFCELYVVVIRLGEDIHVLRRRAEAEGVLEPAVPKGRR